MKRTAELYIGLAIAAVIAYLYIKKKLPAVTQPVSNAIANAYLSLPPALGGLPAPINATHSVILPSGGVVPIANIPGGLSFNSQLNAGQFVYQGVSYLIQGPSDSNGNFSATLPTVPAASYDPTTLAPTEFSLNSPAGPPAVLPYSYKQASIDTPATLGTSDLLTPPADPSATDYSYLDYSLN
ncbi:MAG TPA: hypothetical protein VFA39_19020 [Steroidobacteraceae bacterium]|nr:hypothetical protein [Steroidobacteraceae bacterium]